MRAAAGHRPTLISGRDCLRPGPLLLSRANPKADQSLIGTNIDFQIEIVPADGITLSFLESGDIGTSPFFGQLSVKLTCLTQGQSTLFLAYSHQIEFLVTALVCLCRQLTGLRLVPTRVRLTHRRESDCAELAAFFGIDVEFGAAVDEVAFATTIKHIPVVSADPYLNKLLIRYCEEARSRRPTNRGPFRSSVENEIIPLLPHGKARAGEIARRLEVSQRTFARRLSLEGLTFSDVLENLKSDLAECYLSDEGLSISQIAWLLGYQEVSALTHAFKRWTGKTPREARSHATPYPVPCRQEGLR
jgi:AraC-like DNA-binding protein